MIRLVSKARFRRPNTIVGSKSELLLLGILLKLNEHENNNGIFWKFQLSLSIIFVYVQFQYTTRDIIGYH